MKLRDMTSFVVYSREQGYFCGGVDGIHAVEPDWSPNSEDAVHFINYKLASVVAQMYSAVVNEVTTTFRMER